MNTVYKKRKPEGKVILDRTAHGFVWLIRWVFILAVSYLFIYPIFFMVSTAFQSPASINDPSVIMIPKELSLESIGGMAKMLNYWKCALLTLSISVFSTLAALISCSMTGYGLSRFKFRGKSIIFAFVVLTIIVPPQTILPTMTLNFQFFDFGGLLSVLPAGYNYINLINTVWTFVLPSMFAAGLRSGVFIFIFRQFFLGQPKDLEEAAKIDGCNSFRTYVQIIVPLTVPAFITVMLFSFIWHWNDVYSSALYFTGDVKPLMAMLRDLDVILDRGANVTAYAARTYKASALLLTVLPPLVLYIFAQKYFIEGIERTGIVG